jgi:methionine-rich copper-binding protein CopC
MKTGIRHLAVAGALLLIATFPSTVAAHSEFVSGTPKNGATVPAGPIDIVANFSDTFNSRSRIELLDAAGDVIARGAIDGKTMRIGLEGIEPGEYEVRWTSVAQDGDILRSSDNPEWTWFFTVEAAAASPSAAATPSPVVTTAPSGSAALTPSASASPPVGPSASEPPGGDTSGSTSTNDILLPIVAALVVVALLAAFLLRRRPPAVR